MPESVYLVTCDREPIHIPGSIQSHGCLLACESGGRVVRCSANAKDMLGLTKDPSSQFLSDLFGPSAEHDLMNALTKSVHPRRAGVLFGFRTSNSHAFNVACHTHQGLALFEFEPEEEGATSNDPLEIARSLISKTQALNDLDALRNRLPRFLQAMLGYDRVMVYEFAEDGSGKVVGEAKRQSLESFLGQHFPAADIPRQARALYLQNTIRVIANVGGPKSDIVPKCDASGDPLDLSFAHLRSVLPIHLEYLRNMGVAASMSISVIVEGKLWGLVACHHYAPKILSMSQRIAAELFGDFLSLHLTSLQQRTRAEAMLCARHTLDRILAERTVHDSAEEFLRTALDELGRVVRSDGVGLWMNGTWSSRGSAPPASAIPRLARLASESCANEVWGIHAISERIPGASSFATEAAGMLVVPLSMTQPDFLFFFRKEKLQTLEWAGDPDKAYTTGPNGDRLTPRKSLDVWKQTVELQSDPWTEDERVAANSVLLGLREVLMRHNEILTKERKTAEHRMKVLNDELNHRVKNILALIKSLVNQPTTGVESIEAFVNALKGRILALAHAHDQVVRSDCGGSLSELLLAELSPYPSGQIDLTGPNVKLDPRAYSVMALVVHELATNAAKYGALSVTSGELEVTWSFADEGLKIKWEERKGPPVSEPSRQGFGSVLLHRSVPFDLQGSSEIDYLKEGVVATIVIPRKFVSEALTANRAGAGRLPDAEVAITSYSITGRSGLLVEDQLVIALEAEDMLRALGIEDLITVSTAADALRIVGEEKIDFAVLDVNLGSHNSLAVADELAIRGIPFIFATGYGDSVMIPQHLRSVPIVRKPYTERAIRSSLEEAHVGCAGSTSGGEI